MKHKNFNAAPTVSVKSKLKNINLNVTFEYKC